MRKKTRYNNGRNVKRERAIMIASSVFVLAALTMTGVYVKQNNKNKSDGYSIDFSVLDKSSNKENMLIDENQIAKLDDDLDYFPELEEAGSGEIQIPGLTDGTQTVEKKNTESTDKVDTKATEEKKDQAQISDQLADELAMNADAGEQAIAEEEEWHPELNFSAGDQLIWPVNGNVLINYSMDKSVYFLTLQQYKRNPSIVISAAEGDVITSSAAGIVKSVSYDEELGNVVKMEIGGGYSITYGQLKDIQVSEGNYVEANAIIGYVAAPTKYYSVEGTNVYFAVTKDGTPVNPMEKLP